MKSLHFPLQLMLIVSILLSCGNSTTQGSSSTAEQTGKILRFRKYIYTDKQGTGLEAFSFLMPSDWNFEGGMRWILDNPVMPSATAFRVYNPNGKDEFEVFENRSYFWTNNMQLLGMFPPGSKYFGSVVKKPVTAQSALRNIILSEQRKRLPDLKVLKDEDLPQLPQALNAGKQAQGVGTSGATGAKLRVSYTQNGVPMEEEFYAVVEQFSFPVQGMFATTYNTMWFVDYIFSFKGEKGKIENSTKLFQTITSSFKLSPKWYAKYNNIIEYMAQQQIRQIHSVGEFSRMMSQVSDRISDEKMQLFEKRGEVYDKVSQKFSDNTLGIDRGYNHAWSNNNGEYIVSDNPNFNPNIGSNLDWRQMDRK
jgi:hypothetical protein